MSGAVHFVMFDKHMLLENLWSSCYMSASLIFWEKVAETCDSYKLVFFWENIIDYSPFLSTRGNHASANYKNYIMAVCISSTQVLLRKGRCCWLWQGKTLLK